MRFIETRGPLATTSATYHKPCYPACQLGCNQAAGEPHNLYYSNTNNHNDKLIGCPTPHGVRRRAIHVFPLIRAAKTWMAGPSPAMTMRADCAGGRSFIVAVGITYVSQEAEYVPAKNRRMPVWRDPLRNCRRPRLLPALPLSRLPAAKRRGAYPRCARAQRAGPHPSGHAQAIRHVFCGDCGTPLYVQVATRPDLVGLRVCTLDDPTLVPA